MQIYSAKVEITLCKEAEDSTESAETLFGRSQNHRGVRRDLLRLVRAVFSISLPLLAPVAADRLAVVVLGEVVDELRRLHWVTPAPVLLPHLVHLLWADIQLTRLAENANCEVAELNRGELLVSGQVELMKEFQTSAVSP